MSSLLFHRRYLSSLGKFDLFLTANFKNDSKRRSRLNMLITYLIKVKKSHIKKDIIDFEYQYMRYNLLFLFAKHSGFDVDLFRKGISKFIENEIITKQESYQVLEMSSLNRWSGVLEGQ